MLKTYEKLEDVPEALREHYKLIQGKYVPELSDDHPVLVTNKNLLNEKNQIESKASGLETKVTTLTADLEAAKAGSVPRGHKVVTNAEAEALNTLKEHGTATEIVTKLTEHKTLRDESDKRKREDNLRAVAKQLGYSNVEAFVRLPNLPDLEIKDVNGKKTVVAKVKEGETIVEKPAAEFIESSADIAPFLPALKSSEGVTVHGSSGTDSNQPNDPFASAREWGKQYNEQAKVTSNLDERFGLAKSA
jgi:hypothetical protein